MKAKPTIRIGRDRFHRPDVTGLVLYRCYGLDGTLMYIGRTKNLRNRLAAHRADKPWWSSVEYITAEPHDNLKVLRYNERRAIWMEEPFFNQMHYGRKQISGRGTV